MKSLLILFSFIVLSIGASAQDFATFSNLFPQAQLPYALPEGAYCGYPLEDEPLPVFGKEIGRDLFKTIFDVEMEQSASYQAVAKFEQENYILFIVFEKRMDIYNGNEKRSFLMYTFSKTGEEKGFRMGDMRGIYTDDIIYSEYGTTVSLAFGETEEDKNKIIMKFIEFQDLNALEGDYNERKVSEITHYDRIEDNGSIVNVTTYTPED